jgi:hypothetical protein
MAVKYKKRPKTVYSKTVKSKSTRSVNKTSKSTNGNTVKTRLFPSLKRGSGISSNVNTMVKYSTPKKGGTSYMVISTKKKVFRSAKSALSALNKKN